MNRNIVGAISLILNRYKILQGTKMMADKQFQFDSSQNAEAVASQLYNCTVKDNILEINNFDRQAFKLAIQLAGVPTPIELEITTIDPFPSHERECTEKDTPKIWVGCLAAQNSGYLHGLWLDATRESEEILEDINWMLSYSPVKDREACEDWIICDSENFGSIKIDQYQSIESVSQLAIAISNEELEAFDLFYDYFGYDNVEEAIKKYEERYQGCYEDPEDFAYQLWEDCVYLKSLENSGINESYIDW